MNELHLKHNIILIVIGILKTFKKFSCHWVFYNFDSLLFNSTKFNRIQCKKRSDERGNENQTFASQHNYYVNKLLTIQITHQIVTYMFMFVMKNDE